MLAVISFLIGVAVGGGFVFVLGFEKLRHVRAEDRRVAGLQQQCAKEQQALDRRLQELERQRRELRAEESAIKSGFATLHDLRKENALLKRDLQNIDVNINKLELDRDRDRESQAALENKVSETGRLYLRDNVKWIGSSITPNNFTACKQRLLKVIEQCRAIGFDVPGKQEAELVADLQKEFEKAVRAAFEREEQARIKTQIREEQLRGKEIERELKQLDREREAIKAALDKALAEAHDEHSAEVERLKARLAEAEEKSQRAISQAQLTKSGNVYVISNIGSFGEGVFKIGMTRRLEPMDRVRELGDASVPFPFDVHMMISCDDAPTLENALHRAFHKTRLNKMKPRKEFYRTNIEAVRQVVEENHGEVQCVADPEALEYRQSLTMSDEDEEYIEAVYDKLDQGKEGHADDE
jgi:hypothetical protein